MAVKKNKVLSVFVHIILWLFFLSLPTIFNPHRTGVTVSDFLADFFELPRSLNGLFLIVVFYCNYYISIPQLYLRHKYLPFFIFILGCFALLFLLNFTLIKADPTVVRSAGFKFFGSGSNFFMFINVFVVSFTIRTYEQWQSTKEQMLNTEISFLKAQINPHFLFNTLNSIYALTLIKSDNAPDAVVKLSGMMRYSISEANLVKVSLAKEIGYISNYIELQKLRITDKIVITFEVTGDPEGKTITPFLLIPFVENAFKYGVNSEENSDIWIKIEINEHHLHMQVENNKVFVRKDKDYGTSLGIKNTKMRLQLLYSGMYELKIKDGKYDFMVSLFIKFL
jgi:sensor histidine kinase YesM